MSDGIRATDISGPRVLRSLAFLLVLSCGSLSRAQIDSEEAIAEAIKGWLVKVNVVDEQGKPVAMASVGLQLGRGEPTWFEVGEDGEHALRLPGRDMRYCYIKVKADGFTPMRAFWSNSANRSDPLPEEFTFKMSRGVSVGGQIVNEGNLPIANATVFFSAGDHSKDATERAGQSFYKERYVTDQLGRWRCDIAPANMTDASIMVDHPGYAVDKTTYSLDRKIPDLRVKSHKWTLKSGFIVRGRVVDGEGKPVFGASLAIGELNLYDDDPIQTTDENGDYRFERVAPHHDNVDDDDPIRFTITAVKRGFAPKLESIPGYGGRPMEKSNVGERIVDFQLSHGVPLKIFTKTKDGEPIPGATIYPESWKYTDALEVLRDSTMPRASNNVGVWVWNDAPAGSTIRFDASARGYSRARDVDIEIKDQPMEQTIRLSRPQIVSGTVIDALTKEPIKEFVVEHAFEGVTRFDRVKNENVTGLSWTSQRTKGQDGKYTKRMTMPPLNGSYTYRVQAKGYQARQSRSVPYKEGETELNFQLNKE